MSNDWINEVQKKNQLLFLLFFFVLLVGCLFVSIVAIFFRPGLIDQTRAPHQGFPVDSVHNRGENFEHLFWKCRRILMSLDCIGQVPGWFKKNFLMNDKQNRRKVLLRYHENGRILWLHPESVLSYCYLVQHYQKYLDNALPTVSIWMATLQDCTHDLAKYDKQYNAKILLKTFKLMVILYNGLSKYFRNTAYSNKITANTVRWLSVHNWMITLYLTTSSKYPLIRPTLCTA